MRNTKTGAPGFGTTAGALPGETLEYRLTYTNTGQAPATDVTISDAIQAGQTYVSPARRRCTQFGLPTTS